MKNKEKQIEEIAKVLQDEQIKTTNTFEEFAKRQQLGINKCNAEALYNAGYRKESVTAKEILDEVSKHYGGAWLVELYKKYGVE